MTSTKASGQGSKMPASDPQPDHEPGRHRLARFATQNAVRRQRRVWSGRVASWDQHGSAGLTTVTAAVLKAAEILPAVQVVDLGCGTARSACRWPWRAPRSWRWT